MRKLREIIINLLVWIYCVITVVTFGTLVFFIRKHFWVRIWCKGLIKLLGVRLKVYKEENLPKGVYVFMSNHQSQLDIPVLETVLEPYNIRFLAKRSLFNIPFFGWGIRILGYVPVEREDPREGLKSIFLCLERLREGYSLVVFPEGTRSKTGELLPFKLGGFLIPLKAKVKVVPVTIWGTKDILPKGSIWFNLCNSREIKIYIGKPIDTSDLSLRDKKNLALLVKQEMENGLKILKEN